ncbi:diaminopimelate epimerase [Methyloceanibacter sp. wino2]|uniref:diaminopimelate epimerase n=1 Tax=Methyloceanibacter sp. wino2 TaxID=2170729 RepID=UPI000D3EA353|nr:diaminopimelate epimerase [Methyloceanibacter sp. wino2]
MSATTHSFRKMNGLGNDFVVIDRRTDELALPADAVRAIADRAAGIGCDQLITLDPSSEADVFMRIWNADGGEVAACGNAARCVAGVVAGELGRPSVTIETEDQVLGAYAGADGLVTIDMGEPRLAWDEIPLAEEFHDTSCIELQAGPIDAPVLHSPGVVSMGNPHAIFFVDDVETIDLGRIGPMLEHHPRFPERANISVAQIVDEGHIRLRTWERGAGLTRACGTAACASAVAAVRRGLTDRKVTVSLPGGDLVIEWREGDGHVLMTGPYALDFEGTLPPALLGSEAQGV